MMLVDILDAEVLHLADRWNEPVGMEVNDWDFLVTVSNKDMVKRENVLGEVKWDQLV